jgi:hypothetical protein
MSRTNRSTVRCPRIIDLAHDEDLEFHPELVPLGDFLHDSEVRVTLDAILRAHRSQLVATARYHLGNHRQDAEDLVQDLCVEALEGRLTLSRDPWKALDDLLEEVIARCDGGDY